MTLSKAMRSVTMLAVGLAAAVACGGRSQRATPSSQGDAGMATGGAVSGAAAGGAMPAAQAGMPASGGSLVPSGAGGEAGGVAGAIGSGGEPADDPIGWELNEFGFAWRDAFMLLPCYKTAASNCHTTPGGPLACPNQDAPDWRDRGLVLSESFATGGEVGSVYSVRLVVNGIVSGKYYQGGSRDQAADFSDLNRPEGSDGFHRGGSPVESSFDSWEIIVRGDSGDVVANYYLNSYPQASALEFSHTVPLGFEKDLEVPGGGSIEYRVHDPNCYAPNNCGEDLECGTGRLLPNEAGLELPEMWHGAPLASYNVVNGAKQPFHAQLIHLRVISSTYVGELQ